jgi:hypothetical protein
LNHNFWIMTLVANHFNISIMSLIGLLLVFCSCVQFMVVAYSLRDIGAMTWENTSWWSIYPILDDKSTPAIQRQVKQQQSSSAWLQYSGSEVSSSCFSN